MMTPLTYDNFERIRVRRPVDRLSFICEECVGKIVLDLGCLDETALAKQETPYWLHGRIAKVAAKVIGIDNSERVPLEGIATGKNARIWRGDAERLEIDRRSIESVEVVVAGEFIEHLDCPIDFLRILKKELPGRTLLLSTPNGPSISNVLMGSIRCEAQHPDHLRLFTYKTLNTNCDRAGFSDWEIIPYQFYATEMELRLSGTARAATSIAASIIRMAESVFPLLSFGYIVKVRI